MNKNIAQNLLFCFLIMMLGVLANVLNTVVDRIALSFGQQATMAGLYISIFALGSLISITLSSGLADIIGKRFIIVAGIISMMCGILLLAFSQHMFLSLVGLFLMGFGFGPTEAMTSALLNDENPAHAGRWMNISQAGFSFGSIFAPILTVAYLSHGRSFGEVFLICGFVFVLVAIIIFQTTEESILLKTGEFTPTKQMFTVLKSREFRLYALMIFFYLGYESIAPSYIKQLFRQNGHTETMAASMISLFWISMIISRLIGILLSNHELTAIKFFTAIAIMGILLLVFVKLTWLRVIGVILLGFGCGPVWPMLIVLSVKVFPERSGSAVGVMLLCSTAGVFLFPFLIGTLAGNLTITFSLCAFLGILVLTTAFKASRLH